MATTAAVGTAFAGAALAGPATVAPAIANMACQGYQHSTITTTHLALKRRAAEYGTRNVANVTVTSDAGVPRGRVRITTPRNSWTVSLDRDGFARHGMSRWMPKGSYWVSAHFIPACRSNFKRSYSGRKPYTVLRAHTNVIHLDARNIARGGHPWVSLDVVSRTGITVHGKVRIRLYHHSHLRRTRTVRLSRGHASARFAKVWQRRSWDVTVHYLGTRNFRRSQDDTSFWVRRRR